ncbi:Hsp20/alpha crystallin family protein [Sphaerothrix gracilis]|uniref:Hsp20/alpha crystallin family protein n=1 Tax=Sphaerothrix gracilis TaxID=3151835 RepID=UPI0031FD3949
MRITPWPSPWMIDPWQRQIDDLFFDTGLFHNGFSTLPDWNLELTETDAALILTAWLPGLSAYDIGVQVDSERVILSACQHQQQSDRYSQMLGYGQMQQVISLPCQIDRDRVRSEMRGNQLVLTLPKAQPPFPGRRMRQIQLESTWPEAIASQGQKLALGWKQAKRWLGRQLSQWGDRLLKD